MHIVDFLILCWQETNAIKTGTNLLLICYSLWRSTIRKKSYAIWINLLWTRAGCSAPENRAAEILQMPNDFHLLMIWNQIWVPSDTPFDPKFTKYTFRWSTTSKFNSRRTRSLYIIRTINPCLTKITTILSLIGFGLLVQKKMKRISRSRSRFWLL